MGARAAAVGRLASRVTDEHFEKALQQTAAGCLTEPQEAIGEDSGFAKQNAVEPEIQASAASCDLLREKSGNARKRKAGVDGNRTHLATFQPPHRF